MNLYNNILDVLWEHLAKFEMNTQKHFLNNVTNVFHYLKDFLKDLKWFENDKYYRNCFYACL
jgi:hypothetical protein